MSKSFSKMGHSSTVFSKSLCAAALLVVPFSAFAANNTWTGAGGATWDTGTTASWTIPTTWTAGDTAIFGATGNGPITVDAAGVSAAGITINAGATGYVFSGGTVTSTAAVNVNENVQFNNNLAISGGNLNVALGKTLTLNGGGSMGTIGLIGSTGAATINFTGGDYSFGGSSFWSNAGSATKTLNMNFTGTSTFTVANNSVIGYNSPVNITYNSSGVSTFTTGSNIGRGDVIPGSGKVVFTIQQGQINSAGNTNLGYGADATLDIQGGVFNAGTQANQGTQSIVLNNNNAFASLLSVNGGTLTAGTISLNSATGGSSTFQLNSGTANINTINQANGGTKTINLAGGVIGTSTGNGTWAVGMNVTGNTKIRAATATGTSANITISGVLSGSSNINKTGAGALTLTGINTTYSGVTTVEAGTLASGTTGNFGTNNVVLQSSTILTLGNNQSISDTATLMFASNSTVNLSYTGTETVGGLYNTTTSSYVADGLYTAAQLNSLSGGNFQGAGLLLVSAVPEPGSAALAALGALSLLCRRRK